mmetsp:Transcript_3629/g.12791  ORF Transcript_3629/g.12791 Transcript_3629/m.12791 type:complete len:97 (-) Transcript_3629:953-1243(-)
MASCCDMADGGAAGQLRGIRVSVGRTSCAMGHVWTHRMALRVSGHRTVDVEETSARRSASVVVGADVVAMERRERSVLGMVWRCAGGRDVDALLPQ